MGVVGEKQSGVMKGWAVVLDRRLTAHFVMKPFRIRTAEEMVNIALLESEPYSAHANQCKRSNGLAARADCELIAKRSRG